MKIFPITLLLGFLLPLYSMAQNRENVNLFGQYHRGDARYSGSWVYIDLESRREYALLGTRTGTAIYTIDEQPVQELAFIPGPASNWREITVLGKYAYVTTEGSGEGEGMQIIDLSNLPTSANLVNTYTATFTNNSPIQSGIDFQWDFGPGNGTYNGVNPPPVSFNTSGAHSVTLIATSLNSNCSDTIILEDIVEVGYGVDFEFTPSNYYNIHH